MFTTLLCNFLYLVVTSGLSNPLVAWNAAFTLSDVVSYFLSQPRYIPPSFQSLLWNVSGDDIQELVPVGDRKVVIFLRQQAFLISLINHWACHSEVSISIPPDFSCTCLSLCLHLNESSSPLWLEFARGGTVEQYSSSATLDMRARSISEESPLGPVWEGVPTTSDNDSIWRIISGFKCFKPVMSDTQKSCDSRVSRLGSPLFIRQWAVLFAHCSDRCCALMLTCRNSPLWQSCCCRQCNNVLSSFWPPWLTRTWSIEQCGHHVTCVSIGTSCKLAAYSYTSSLALWQRLNTSWWMQRESA